MYWQEPWVIMTLLRIAITVFFNFRWYLIHGLVYDYNYHSILLFQVFISDCIGVHWIGFCQISFGIGSAVSAFLNGFLARFIPQYILVYIGALVNIGTVIFLLVWERQPNYYIVFIVLLLWGYCEGLWSSVPPSKFEICRMVYWTKSFFPSLYGLKTVPFICGWTDRNTV